MQIIRIRESSFCPYTLRKEKTVKSTKGVQNCEVAKERNKIYDFVTTWELGQKMLTNKGKWAIKNGHIAQFVNK